MQICVVAGTTRNVNYTNLVYHSTRHYGDRYVTPVTGRSDTERGPGNLRVAQLFRVPVSGPTAVSLGFGLESIVVTHKHV